MHCDLVKHILAATFVFHPSCIGLKGISRLPLTRLSAFQLVTISGHPPYLVYYLKRMLIQNDTRGKLLSVLFISHWGSDDTAEVTWWNCHYLSGCSWCTRHMVHMSVAKVHYTHTHISCVEHTPTDKVFHNKTTIAHNISVGDALKPNTPSKPRLNDITTNKCRTSRLVTQY